MDVPLLLTIEEANIQYDKDKVDVVTVQTVDGMVEYHRVKEAIVRKRPRSSLSPRHTTTSPASKRLLQVQKELREATDFSRKLNLLSQYQRNGEYEKIDGLIVKWEGIVKEAVETLWREAQCNTSISYEQFLAALQLGRNIESILNDSDDTDGDDMDSDESVMNCLREAEEC